MKDKIIKVPAFMSAFELMQAIGDSEKICLKFKRGKRNKLKRFRVKSVESVVHCDCCGPNHRIVLQKGIGESARKFVVDNHHGHFNVMAMLLNM